MAIKVQDSFTDTNGTAATAHTPDVDVVGGGWLLFDTTDGEIQNNALQLNGTGQGIVIDSGVADCAVSFNWTPAVGVDNRNSIVVRYTDANNYWELNAREPTNDVRMREVVAGTATNRGTTAVTFTEGTTYALKADLSGTSIDFLVDSVSKILYTSATHNQTATKHGAERNIGDVASVIDDFLIETAASSTGSGASVGLATVVSTGQSLNNTIASSAGTSSVSGNIISLVDAIFSSTGLATPLGTGQSLNDGVFSTAGTGVVTGSGQSLADSLASSIGLATGVSTGQSLNDASASAVGLASLSGVGLSLVDALASSSGVANINGVMQALFNAIASSTGIAIVAGQSYSPGQATAVAAGLAVVTGALTALSNGLASSSGNSSDLGIGKSLNDTIASSSGIATSSVLAEALFAALASSTGTSIVSGNFEALFSVIASSAGVSSLNGIGLASFSAIASSSGSSVVLGINPATPVILKEINFVLTLSNKVNLLGTIVNKMEF